MSKSLTLSPEVDSVEYTHHALENMQKRAISEEMVITVLTHNDKMVNVKNGDVSISVSKKRLKTLQVEDKISLRMYEKLIDIRLVAIIIDVTNGQSGLLIKLKTALHDLGKRGKYHNKNIPFHKSKKKIKIRT